MEIFSFHFSLPKFLKAFPRKHFEVYSLFDIISKVQKYQDTRVDLEYESNGPRMF